jgi:hypothetical protein
MWCLVFFSSWLVAVQNDSDSLKLNSQEFHATTCAMQQWLGFFCGHAKQKKCGTKRNLQKTFEGYVEFGTRFKLA